MPRDALPRPDGELGAWVENLRAWLEAHYAEVGLTEDDYTAIKKAAADWQAAAAAALAAQAAMHAATEAKLTLRRELEQVLRPRLRVVQAHQGTTDTARAAMGITIAEPRTRAVPTPMAAPRVLVDAASRLTHTLRVLDASTPTRRGKPRGVLGAEIYYATFTTGSPPPADPRAMHFLTLATGPTVRKEFSIDEAGSSVAYLLRYTNRRGDKGPWSELATAGIAA